MDVCFKGINKNIILKNSENISIISQRLHFVKTTGMSHKQLKVAEISVACRQSILLHHFASSDQFHSKEFDIISEPLF